MYYLDDDLSLQEAVEKPVYRVFGGDSSLEGGYLTDSHPQNPIQARSDLALSQHDFIGDDGDPIRNTASQVASCTMYTDDGGHIINLATGEVTDEILDFTEVEPTSDLPGGGLEHHLQGDFEDMVQVDTIEDLRHTPTEGWQNYLQAEDYVLNGCESSDTDEWDETVIPETADIDTLLDEEIYNIAAEDVQQPWENYIGEYAEEDGVDTETDSIDALIDDEEYNIQAEDVQKSWENDINNYDSDDITPETTDIDALIDDEEYNLQAEDVQESWENYVEDYGNNDDGSHTPADIDALIDDEEYNLQAEDVQESWENYIEDYDNNDDSDSDSWDDNDYESWEDDNSDSWEDSDSDSWDNDSDSWDDNDYESWDDSDSDSWDDSDGDDS